MEEYFAKCLGGKQESEEKTNPEDGIKGREKPNLLSGQESI